MPTYLDLLDAAQPQIPDPPAAATGTLSPCDASPVAPSRLPFENREQSFIATFPHSTGDISDTATILEGSYEGNSQAEADALALAAAELAAWDLVLDKSPVLISGQPLEFPNNALLVFE